MTPSQRGCLTKIAQIGYESAPVLPFPLDSQYQNSYRPLRSRWFEQLLLVPVEIPMKIYTISLSHGNLFLQHLEKARVRLEPIGLEIANPEEVSHALSRRVHSRPQAVNGGTATFISKFAQLGRPVNRISCLIMWIMNMCSVVILGGPLCALESATWPLAHCTLTAGTT